MSDVEVSGGAVLISPDMDPDDGALPRDDVEEFVKELRGLKSIGPVRRAVEEFARDNEIPG